MDFTRQSLTRPPAGRKIYIAHHSLCCNVYLVHVVLVIIVAVTSAARPAPAAASHLVLPSKVQNHCLHQFATISSLAVALLLLQQARLLQRCCSGAAATRLLQRGCCFFGGCSELIQFVAALAAVDNTSAVEVECCLPSSSLLFA